MRCSCCDKQLTDKEIVWNKELGQWEICSFCLESAMDAAYSNGFQQDNDDTAVLVGEESFDDDVHVEYKDYQALGGIRLEDE